MQTVLTQLMIKRDKLMLKRHNTKWYQFGTKNRLTRLINLYKSDIDKEMSKQLDNDLMQ